MLRMKFSEKASIRWVRQAVAISLAMFGAPAFAYLDPSTGSMIVSAIVGIFATVGLALKTYWYKFKSLFRGQKAAPESSAVAESTRSSDEEQS